MEYGVVNKMRIPSLMPRSPLLQSAPSRNGPVHGQNGVVPPPSLWSPKIHGTAVTPKPTPMEMAKMIRFLREFKSALETTDKPETKTLQKRNVVMPPTTQSGMEEMMPETLDKTPNAINQRPQHTPALLEAHLVKAITPLFWENVVLGMPVAKAAAKEHKPSESKPPWTDLSNSSDSVSSSDASYVAWISPIVSTDVTKKAINNGNTAGP